MRAAVSTVDLDAGSLIDRVRASARMEGADLAKEVTTAAAYEAAHRTLRETLSTIDDA